MFRAECLFQYGDGLFEKVFGLGKFSLLEIGSS